MTRYIKKKKQIPMNFNIVYDDREKRPWTFLEREYGAMKKKRLKCGDYSIEGFEDYVAIEKKSGVDELFKDLAGGYRETFRRFLKRLSKYPVKCIVVESELRASSIDSLLYVLMKMSNGRMKLTSKTIYYWVGEIINTYDIPILFVNASTARMVLPHLFESAFKKVQEIKK